MKVQWKACWIWRHGETSPTNAHLCARRDFDNVKTDCETRIHVTADSRYRLYLNGEWLGDGPARSFYFNQQFDTYDITGLINSGNNSLAVLVSHYGEANFQYQPSGRAGLLVQMEQKNGRRWDPVVVTDKSWQVASHCGFLKPTGRISCQMPFEEIFDARQISPQWMTESSLPKCFEPAQEIGKVGCQPWKKLVARSIPMLTREPVVPTRVLETTLATPVELVSGANLRPYLLPGYFQQNARSLSGFMATLLVSPKKQTVVFHRHSFRNELPIVNGKQIEDGENVTLAKGANLCLIAPHPHAIHHEYDRWLVANCNAPVELKALWEGDSQWTVFGPLKDYLQNWEQVIAAKQESDLMFLKDHSQPIAADYVYTHGSPWIETTYTKPVAKQPKIENLAGLSGSDAEVTTILPTKQGDTEVFIDFGREYVGYTEFDLVASDGVILDFNYLEEIEDGVRTHYTEGNLCSLRYICHEGRNRYTSLLRKGFRYCKLTARNLQKPLQIRSVRVLFSTYPSYRRGSFSCSDELLTRIWEVGRHTLRCCSEDTFTDCPTYEQTYWVGDARNEAMINYAAYGDIPLTRRCAELPAESLFRSPLPESQVPSGWENILPAWSLLWILMVEEHYSFSGDKTYLRQVFPAVRKTLMNCKKMFTNELGLFSIEAWNMFDWAGQDSGHRVVTHNQFFLIEALQRAIHMAEVLGKKDDQTSFSEYRKQLISAVNKHLWSDQHQAYIDAIHDDGTLSSVVSQQANSLAIAYGIVPKSRLKHIKDVPIQPKQGMVAVGSPFALFYILEALAHREHYAEILEIVRKRWGEMLQHGATTFWEVFPGFDPKWWTRSYCHAWSAAPTYFLTRYQLGVWWAEPGYTSARIAPQPLDLAWAKGSVPTPHGSIEVDWKNCPDGFHIEIKLPPQVSAELILPGKPSTYKKISAGRLKPVKTPAGWTLKLKPGQHVQISALR